MRAKLLKKYARLADPGIRDFLIVGEEFYPPDAVSFSLAEQRDFYDRYCAHFRNSRPSSVTAEDFSVGQVACRRYRTAGTGAAPARASFAAIVEACRCLAYEGHIAAA